MRCYLAVDIGASSGRHIAAWLDGERIEMKEVYRFQNGMERRGGHLCWDLQGLTQNVIAGLRAAHEQGFDPISVGIDTWAVDFVPLDAQGKPVGELVAYRDDRTQGVDRRLEERLSFEALYGITGIAKQPFNTVYQMMALLEEHPEYAKRVRDFLMVPEYLAYRLTGQRVHEWTNASTTALADARSKRWSAEVIGAAGLPEHWFEAQPQQPGARIGRFLPHIRAAVGFDADVVLTATHDTGSAYIAVPALEEGAVFLSSGTWSLLGTELPGPVLGNAAREAGFTNEGGYAGTTRFLKNIMGMWMLQCIHRETGGAHGFAEMAQMAAGSGYSAYVNASDQRFLAPASMLEEVRRALSDQGAPEPGTLADVLRAVTVGLAVGYRDAIAGMEAITGKRFTSVNIVGGGSQNDVLNQLTADATGLPVYAGPSEGTALGNLAVQMIADGALGDLAGFRRALAASVHVKPFYPAR